jgi:predicted  nucleic acid-binding Zn-ribbon protein
MRFRLRCVAALVGLAEAQLEQLTQANELLAAIHHRLGGLMAEVDDLRTALEGLSASVNDAKTRVSSDLDGLRQEIEDLNAQSPTDLQPLLDSVTAIKENVDSIDAAVPAVEPAPDEGVDESVQPPEGEA